MKKSTVNFIVALMFLSIVLFLIYDATKTQFNIGRIIAIVLLFIGAGFMLWSNIKKMNSK